MPLNPAVRLAYPLIGSTASGAGVMSTLDAPARRVVRAGCWAGRPRDAKTRRARIAQDLSTRGACHLLIAMSSDDSGELVKWEVGELVIGHSARKGPSVLRDGRLREYS